MQKLKLLLAVVFITIFAQAMIVLADPIDHIERILPASTPYHVAILHRLDPISSSWSFYCNRPGTGVSGHSLVNVGSDIRFAYGTSVQVGIQGGEVGRIIDLGSETSMQATYGCNYCLAGIQFSTDGVLSVSDKTGALKTLDLTGMTKDTVPVQVGNIYLARIYSSSDSSDTGLVVKFVVTSVLMGSDNNIETITMRHQPMYVKTSSSAGRGDCPNQLNTAVTQAETAISFSVIGLVATIFVGVGNIAFLIYYCTLAKGKRTGVYSNLQ